MASIENSLKYESEVSPGKVRLVASREFVRAYNHSAWIGVSDAKGSSV